MIKIPQDNMLSLYIKLEFVIRIKILDMSIIIRVIYFTYYNLNIMDKYYR
jgi:hypothetical protein